MSITDSYLGYIFNIGIPVSIINSGNNNTTAGRISFASLYKISQTEYVIKIVVASSLSSGNLQSFTSIKADNISIYYL